MFVHEAICYFHWLENVTFPRDSFASERTQSDKIERTCMEEVRSREN